MDIGFIKEIASLGVGALFGIVVYFMSLREHRSDRQALVDLVARVYSEGVKCQDSLREVVRDNTDSTKKNTEVLVRLATIIETLQGQSRL